MPSRRDMLRSAAACCASAAFVPATHMLEAAEGPLTLELTREKPRPIPPDFIGLGYELSSAARPGLIDAANAEYVQLVRNLGPGVMRFGGIVADFSSYEPDGQTAWEPKRTVLTRANLKRIRGFLDAVGWSAIWSVNFGRGSLPAAITEARDLYKIFGPRLLALELGNEVENYSHGEHPLRHPPYSYEDYRSEYNQWHAAISTVVSGVRFAAPDTAASVEWVERMAVDAQGAVQLLTTHYYRGDQRRGTPEQLAQPDPELQSNLLRLQKASERSGIPWRMCETNSFYGGGRPGVSDALPGALWALDFMLLLLASGCSGINMETGVNQLGFLSSYSPIRDDAGGRASAGAPYYGMLAFAEAVKGATSLLPVRFQARGLNVAAYALGMGDRLGSVVVVNKCSDRAVRISLPVGLMRRPKALRLTDTAGVALGRVAVDADGRWAKGERQSLNGNNVLVEPNSAMLIS